MINEWEEFCAYTGTVSYTASKKIDTTWLGRFTFATRQPFPQETLPCILVHEMPGLLPHGLPQNRYPFRRQTAEQGVQLVRIVCVLLPSGI